MTPGKRFRILNIINSTNIIWNRATRGNDDLLKCGATAPLIENRTFHAPQDSRIDREIGEEAMGRRSEYESPGHRESR